MRYYILLIFTIHNIDTFSQKLKGTVYEFGSSKTIPFAQITNNKKNIGITADVNGNFIIPEKFIQYMDSIHVYAFGYESIYTKLIYSNTSKYNLKKLTYEYKTELTTFKKYNEKKYFGALTRYPIGSITISSDSLNSEYGLRIFNDKYTEGIIKKVNFYVLNTDREPIYYRIRFYQDSLGIPGKEISSNNIIAKVFKRKGWVSKKIKKHKLIMPINGCHVSIECLNIYQELNHNSNKKQLCLTNEFDSSLLFIRDNAKKWIHTSLFIPNKPILLPINSEIYQDKNLKLQTVETTNGTFHNLLLNLTVSSIRTL